ncbi:hypothetical protein BKA70DRAFT_655568 [Coprinopsis sp. MPI-PUGE-AT-0042]|nr:hypothetical protein BKA70DRAFT_655568 [Coprinopsis sp. MPI-PUGE-AT-0042]
MSDSQLQLLEGRIAALSDLYSQLQLLRQLPHSLLRTNPSNVLEAPAQLAATNFQRVSEVAALVRSDPVQSALHDAEKCIRTDSSNLDTNFRRENRKRRRPPSPESPKPYVPAEKVRVSFFPPPEEQENEGAPVTLDTLVAFTRQFNKPQKEAKKPLRLHIWQRAKEQGHERRPRMMRFTIPEVMTAFITLGYHPNNTVLVQTVAVFGFRERKTPHTQSDFGVFRLITQQIGKMIRSEEQVPLRAMVDLLCSYEGLFLDKCTACNLPLAAEGHEPPVVRVWKASNREPRHLTCIDE